MNWNEEDFVMSADSQFNGGPEYVSSTEEFPTAFDSYKSKYQVGVSSDLGRLPSYPGTGPIRSFHATFNSGDAIADIRRTDQQRLGYPVEFYQSALQRPEWHVDFKGRYDELHWHICSRANDINWMFGEAFDNREAGKSIDAFVHSHVNKMFPQVDDDMRGMIAGYLTQKPLRAMFFIDVEAIDERFPKAIIHDPKKYFEWLETPYQVLKSALQGFGVHTLGAVTGKGFHMLTQVPLYHDGHISDAIMELMRIGGHLQPETMDKLSKMWYGAAKPEPVALLSQKAHQGLMRLIHFVELNTIDTMRHELSRRGHLPYIGFTDNHSLQIALDFTFLLRQIDMSCFGSLGSIYNKSTDRVIIRIPRSRDGQEFFNNDLDLMLHTRGDEHAARPHIIGAGCHIPASHDGILRLIQEYEKSNLKRLYDAFDRPLDGAYVSELHHTNYGKFRGMGSAVNEIIDQGDLLNPKTLQYLFEQLANHGQSEWDMVHLLYAVYCDQMKGAHIPNDFYSKAEWCKWPLILRGELFKG